MGKERPADDTSRAMYQRSSKERQERREGRTTESSWIKQRVLGIGKPQQRRKLDESSDAGSWMVVVGGGVQVDSGHVGQPASVIPRPSAGSGRLDDLINPTRLEQLAAPLARDWLIYS